MVLISSSVHSAPRPTIRYSTLSQPRRSCRLSCHIVGAWHWKHFATSTSLPGPSGKPAGFARCAAADEARKKPQRRTETRIADGRDIVTSVVAKRELMYHPAQTRFEGGA